MVFRWRIRASAFTGDIRMFYNSILLHQDHWKYQKILINPDLSPDSEVLIAVITTLIYGVRPVGNQCEEGIKLLAMEVREKLPLVANLLLEKRYINDLRNNETMKTRTRSKTVLSSMSLTSLMTRLVSLRSAILPKMIVRRLLIARF